MTICAHAMPESRRWQVTRKFQLFVSGPFGFASESNVWNIITGVPQLPTSSRVVASGAARWRRTREAGALLGEKSNEPQVVRLAARTVYQKLLGPGSARELVLLSRRKPRFVFASCDTTDRKSVV